MRGNRHTTPISAARLFLQIDEEYEFDLLPKRHRNALQRDPSPWDCSYLRGRSCVSMHSEDRKSGFTTPHHRSHFVKLLTNSRQIRETSTKQLATHKKSQKDTSESAGCAPCKQNKQMNQWVNNQPKQNKQQTNNFLPTSLHMKLRLLSIRISRALQSFVAAWRR